MNNLPNQRTRINKLRSQLASCMQRDRFRLSNSLRKLSKSKTLESTEVDDLEKRIAESNERRDKRLRAIPEATLDEELPIAQRRDEIAEVIANHQVVVVSGETGSGKSTQLPLIALQLGLGAGGLIGHTQPRRIAARSVANRVASQLNSKLGESVGFKIRFDDKTSEQTYVKLMTDGILLAETQSDKFLDQYEMIIIDEAHERSLNIDFLIGQLKRIIQKRSDLKIVITSATIDTQRFAEHFKDEHGVDAPIINVEGRTYPVEMRYEPARDAEIGNDDFIEHLVTTTQNLVREETGDVLIFLPTEKDIKTVSKKLRSVSSGGAAIDVLPLYARLSTDQQNAIFQPGKKRRIVLATNVAESSITVPGIRMVIDSGTARISRYAPRSKVQRLPIEPVSQASSNQRAGRCGRIGPGICVRLYSEDDYLSRPEFTTPEIRRTNLASVILQTLALNLGDISEFPFIDPPQADAISDGYKTLFEIGAIETGRRLTKLGHWLSKIPVDPRIGKMLHAGAEENCLHEILIIASALEVQDVRIRPAEKQQQADQQHEKFRHEKSDFMSYLKIWDFFHKLRDDLSRSKFRKACQQNFLSLNMIHQWQEVHRQLKNVVRQNGLKINQRNDDYNAIHRSLLTGLLSGIAMLTERHEYTGSGGIKFHLWPGSGVFEAKPKWIVASEIIETARRYGRTVGKIAPEWLEPVSKHLAKKQYVDPHWSKKQQTVMAYENVTLFGLPIVLRRRIGYTKIDAEISRQLFIENGLAEFEIQFNFKFLEHNRQLLENVDSLAAKSRRRDLVIDAGLLHQFYENHLPDNCVDVASLRKAIKSSPELDKILRLDTEDLQLDNYEISADLFPDEVQIGSMNLPVEYRFEPGAEADGATIKIPQAGLSQLNESQAGWLVPGLNETRIVAMIKSLPKSIRRNLVPAPETANTVYQALVPGQGNFTGCVSRELSKISGDVISPDMFDMDKIDECLRVNLQVIDDDGEVVAEGRNVIELRRLVGGSETASYVEVENSSWHQDGLTKWNWGDLPTEINMQRGIANVTLYPTVVEQDNAVGLRLVDSKENAKHFSKRGMVRLFAMQLKKSLKRQVNWLPELDHHVLKLSSLLPVNELHKGLKDTIARLAFESQKKLPRSEAEFEARLESSTESISIATQQVSKWLPRFAKAVHAALLAQENLPNKCNTPSEQISEQIKLLASDGFLTTTPWKWLQHFPRYFEAIELRCEKLSAGGLAKDEEASETINAYWDKFEAIETQLLNLLIFDPDLEQLRWMIEEFRVSQFAQKLGTALTVSPKRLDKLLIKLQKT